MYINKTLCAKFRTSTTCATWLFGDSKSTILAPRPTSNGYIWVTEASLLRSIENCYYCSFISTSFFRCDHIVVYDLNYPRGTTRGVYSRNQGDTFVSISNRVYITFCHSVSNRAAYKRFRVTFKLMGNSVMMH